MCANGKNLDEELRRVEYYNLPTDIYVHYVYLRNIDHLRTVEYFKNKFVSAKTIDVTWAALVCLSCELDYDKDKDACIAIFIHCFTNVFLKLLPKERDIPYSDHRGDPIAARSIGLKEDRAEYVVFYTYDKPALLAAILLKCFKLDATKKILNMDLAIFTLGSVGSSMFTSLKRFAAKTHAAIELKYVRKTIGLDWTPILENIITASVSRQKVFPIILKGDAERLL